MGKVYAVKLLVVDGNALGGNGNPIMEHRAISSIREIVGLTFIGALTLFFIAEVVLAQDVPRRGLCTCAS